MRSFKRSAPSRVQKSLLAMGENLIVDARPPEGAGVVHFNGEPNAAMGIPRCDRVGI
jgi:hypothetical protein